jgi:hypothetical protein
MIEMKPCPFCGHKVDLENPDTLYEDGWGWLEVNGLRSYHRIGHVPDGQECYAMHCPISAGGCGAEISGDSKQEAIEKWNKRV